MTLLQFCFQTRIYHHFSKKNFDKISHKQKKVSSNNLGQQCQFSISFKGKPTHFIHEERKKNFNAEMKIRELLESHNRDAVSC